MSQAMPRQLPCPKTTPLPRQMGSLFQEDVPVTLQAVFRSSPRMVLEEGKAALKLFLTVHVGAGSPALQSFVSVHVVSEPCEHVRAARKQESKDFATSPSGCSHCRGWFGLYLLQHSKSLPVFPSVG